MRSLNIATDIEDLATKERKQQIAQAVGGYRERQRKEAGRKQMPLMLTEDDRDNMKLIKANEPDVKNQGEAVSKALTEFVKKYDEEDEV